MESEDGPAPVEPSDSQQFGGKAGKVMTVDGVRPEVAQHLFEIPFHRPVREIDHVGIIVDGLQSNPVYGQSLVIVAACGVPRPSRVRVSGEDGDAPTLVADGFGLVMRNQFGPAEEVWRIRVRADEDSLSGRIHGESSLLGVLGGPHKELEHAIGGTVDIERMASWCRNQIRECEATPEFTVKGTAVLNNSSGNEVEVDPLNIRRLAPGCLEHSAATVGIHAVVHGDE